MTTDLVRLVVGELLVPFVGWIAGLALGSLLVGVLVVRWSRGRLGQAPRTAGRSLALAAIVLLNLAAVPFAVGLLSVPFAVQRGAAVLLETGAAPVISWTAERGEVLWLEMSGVRPDAPLSSLSEMRAFLAERSGPGSTGSVPPDPEVPARAGLSVAQLGEVAARRITRVMDQALGTPDARSDAPAGGSASAALEASRPTTWGEAVAAIRPSVEARLTRDSRVIAAGFRQGAWLQLVPALLVAVTVWMLTVGLVVLVKPPLDTEPSAAPSTRGRSA